MAMLFTVLLAISASILAVFVTDFNQHNAFRETEAAIDIEIDTLTNLKNSQGSLVAYLEERVKHDNTVRLRYENAAGEWLAGTRQPISANDTTHLGTHQDHSAFVVKTHTFADGSRVTIARSVQPLVNSYQALKYGTWLIMTLMLLVVLVSFAISHFVVSRINRIAATAQAIVDTGDLSQRLAIDSRWDDLSKLSEALNGFLDKIEELMQGVREVSNNIAHDLRTPLSNLRNELETLKGQTVDESHIEALLADTDRILAIFQALLRIATIEKGRRNHAIAKVNVTTLLHDVAELYEPIAEEKDLQLQTNIAVGLHIQGDRDLLFQLFANVLDNAIKFSPKASIIRLWATADHHQVRVGIEDQGPGISESDKDKVFQHFYRGDASRSTPGNGLGLSLVRAIAKQHQADIELKNASGLQVHLTFPPYQ